MSAPTVKVALIGAELAPYAKTGGLGDVCAALVRYLGAAGHDVRPFLPLYSSIDTGDRQLVPVDFLQGIDLAIGPHRLAFDVFTLPQPVSGVPLYFISCPTLYARDGIYTSGSDEAVRFAFLTRAAIECCQRMGWGPDVFHVNDWHTALLPLYLRTAYEWDALFRRSKTLLTIHNVGYQGIFPASVLGELGLEGVASSFYQEDLRLGRLSFLKTGILYATALSTVSRTHALEIQSERYGMGLEGVLRARADDLVGIVNGIDTAEWDPANDPLLPHAYSSADLSGKAKNKRHLMEAMGLVGDDEVPLIGIVSRLVAQKGFELCADVLPDLLRRRDVRLVVLGSGERRYEEMFARLQAQFRGRAAFYRGYSEPLAHLVEAGADLFVMPSRYEPCGLNQMYSQRYGTIPVVRKTGGLADTVEPWDPAAGSGTGFVFEHFTADGLRWAIDRALDAYHDRGAWTKLVANAMARDFSWQSQIEKYVALYRSL